MKKLMPHHLPATCLLAAAFSLCAQPSAAQTPVLVATANTGAGERQLAVGPWQKPVAATKDGNIYILSRLQTAGVNHLHLYRSTDGGASFQPETQVRSATSSFGAVVTGSDGTTLHLVWEEIRTPATGNSVVYGRYDTVNRSWVGADEVLFLGTGTGENGGYLMPDLDVDMEGNPVVATTTHRGQSWSGWMRFHDGSSWSAAQRINVDTFGFQVNVAADREGDYHFVYRTNSGLYGIRYRRWDGSAGAWGAEGEIQVNAGTSNTSSFGMDHAGNKYVLFAKAGTLNLAVAGPGSFTFALHQVAADTGLAQGNNSYSNYALGLVGDTPWVYYSNRAAGMETIFTRAFLGGNLLPEIPFFTQAGRQIQRIAAHRSTQRTMGRALTFISVDAAASREDLMAAVSGAAGVPFGLGCAGSGGHVPYAGARSAPSLGSTDFAVTLSRALGGSAAVLLVGISDTLYAGVPLPLDLAPIGMPGCNLYTSVLLAFPAATSGSGPGMGDALLPMAIPNDPALAGGRVFAQWLVADTAANAAGLSASGSAAAVVR